MASVLRHYLGVGATPMEKDNNTRRALPASWYRSDNLYELERRAIFSRRWILISHQLRFTKPGDWVRFEVAGFPIFIVRDRSGKINGFHNFCRHRAFPVVTEDKGTSQILACKYHGWSYGLNGNLTKAPGYQGMKNFDKSVNGLLSIHTHIDANGFIWINLDASKEPEVQWSDDFLGADTQERFKHFNFKDYHFDHTWSMSGEYNWKVLGDNYNECYHCPLTHPDTFQMSDFDLYAVEGERGYLQHFAGTRPEQEEASGIKFVSTYYFPNACMTVT
jgi:phenylpropionate dioxygenase-like ring-hydroxylating dioxygenase large terminal subunit